MRLPIARRIAAWRSGRRLGMCGLPPLVAAQALRRALRAPLPAAPSLRAAPADVVGADRAAGTGSSDGGEVDAEFGGEAPGERR